MASKSNKDIIIVSSKTDRTEDETKDVERFASIFNNRIHIEKPLKLEGGYVATKVWSIQKASYSSDEIARAQLLTTTWEVKKKPGFPGEKIRAPQRCPAMWVDNLVFQMVPGMDEPKLCLGRWNKTVEVYGKSTNLDGLVVAAGGHVERMGTRDMANTLFGCKIDEGDMSIRAAADKELSEEIGIKKANVIYTHYLGEMNDVLNDPTMHGTRHIFLRFVQQAPKVSEEIKDVFNVNVSDLQGLYVDNDTVTAKADKKQLSLIKGHGEFLRKVMRIPDTNAFLASIHDYCQDAKKRQRMQIGEDEPPSYASDGYR